VDNLAREERYLLVYRWVLYGRDFGEDWACEHAWPEDHFRIVRVGGQWWAESLVEAPRLSADGIPIGPGGAFPLAPGLRINVGGVECRVDEFAQWGL
jgi:hypothetical protein